MNTLTPKLTLVSLITLLLAGCFGAALTTGKMVYNRDHWQQTWKNIHLAHRADIILRQDKSLGRHAIKATLLKGEFLLTGYVPQVSLKKRAKHLIAALPGVNKVINQIRIGSPPSPKQSLYDGWLTSKIKTKLIAHDQINPAQVTVLTENGEVFLFGIVTPKQARIAIAISRDTTGVRKVITLFRYIVLRHDQSTTATYQPT